jgi:cytoskeletal protein RodZ
MIGWRSNPQAAEEEKPKGFDDFELRLGDVMRGERATLGKSLLDVQRELKIKATYIAAIENADVSAFETPGFVAGYVRSYARYLGMDPDWAFQRFCKEANFTVAHGMSTAAAPRAAREVRARAEFADPLANPNAAFVPRGESWLSRVEPGAIGSLAVLAVLVGAIGYGGWSVLQEVQRVQLAPVDEAPAVVAQIDPLLPAGAAPASGQTAADSETDGTDLSEASPEAGAASSDMLDRLYRPQALDVPVMVSRNGPIGAIDPRLEPGGAPGAGTELASGALPGEGAIQVTAEVNPGVEVLAVRPSWVRVTAADGTVLFEKILDAGERYEVPQMEQAALFRTGNSGSVYFVVNGQTYGPAAPGANVVKDIALSPDALTGKFVVADMTADTDLEKIMTADAGGSESP